MPAKVEPNLKVHTNIMPSGPDCSDDILWEQSGWHNLCRPHPTSPTPATRRPETYLCCRLTGPEMWGLNALPTMAHAHTRYGYVGMPDLTHWASDLTNSSDCLSFGMPANCTKMRLTEHDGSLAPGWEALLEGIVRVYQPYFDNGTLIGVFIGDELVATKSFTCDTMAAITTRLKELNPKMILYSNEGGCWPCLGTPAGDKIMTAMDWFSWDRYRAYGQEEAAVSRAWAEQNLYPHMTRPDQRLLLVPGLYATDPVHCIKFTTKHNASCPMDRQEDEMVDKLLNFWEWAQNDTRVIGFVRVEHPQVHSGSGHAF